MSHVVTLVTDDRNRAPAHNAAVVGGLRGSLRTLSPGPGTGSPSGSHPATSGKPLGSTSVLSEDAHARHRKTGSTPICFMTALATDTGTVARGTAAASSPAEAPRDSRPTVTVPKANSEGRQAAWKSK